MSDNALNNEKHYLEKLEKELKKELDDNVAILGNNQQLKQELKESIPISELEALIEKWKLNRSAKVNRFVCIQDLQKLIDKGREK